MTECSDATVGANQNQLTNTHLYMTEASEWAVDIWSDVAMQLAATPSEQAADSVGLDRPPVHIATTIWIQQKTTC